MSNIQTYLDKILAAVYGREVRQSIHDAIAKIDAETTDKMEEAKNIANSAFDSAIESMNIAVTASNNASEAKYMANKIKGGITLWNGAASPGANLVFSIPEECFHNNRTTLTLMVESYTIGSGIYAPYGNKPAFITLCLGTATEIAGTDVGSSYDPYVSKEGYARGHIYSNVHDISTQVDDLNAVIRVKKTADVRYSTAVFDINVGSDSDIVVVGITAIIFED